MLQYDIAFLLVSPWDQSHNYVTSYSGSSSDLSWARQKYFCDLILQIHNWVLTWRIHECRSTWNFLGQSCCGKEWRKFGVLEHDIPVNTLLSKFFFYLQPFITISLRHIPLILKGNWWYKQNHSVLSVWKLLACSICVPEAATNAFVPVWEVIFQGTHLTSHMN